MSYKSLMNWSFWRFEWSYILCFFISYFMTTCQFNHSIVSLRNSDRYRLASGFFCPSGGADAVSAFGSMWPGVSSVHLHPPERINVSMCWWTWANTPVGRSISAICSLWKPPPGLDRVELWDCHSDTTDNGTIFFFIYKMCKNLELKLTGTQIWVLGAVVHWAGGGGKGQ